jgi:alkylation response protein AidB-like acyl-CoA dehydrogenase
MRFSLTADQIAFRDAVRDLLAAECPPAVVRGAPSAVWERLADMGLFGAAVPESAGGLGLDEADLVPVLIEIGAAAVPHPVAETLAVAAPLLSTVDSSLLPELVSGKLRVTVGSRLIPYASSADLVLELAPAAVRVVSAGAGESTVDPSRPLSRVGDAGRVLTDDPGLVGLTRDRAELAAAAQLVGLGRRMLDLTTSYVVTRHQFGVPVGSFQAVKHHLANALLELDFAAPAVLAAGWALQTRTGQARAVSMAAILAAEAATRTARAAIQCHGAIGYTVEYELHRFAKRAWALAATIDIDEHLERIAEELEL